MPSYPDIDFIGWAFAIACGVGTFAGVVSAVRQARRRARFDRSAARDALNRERANANWDDWHPVGKW